MHQMQDFAALRYDRKSLKYTSLQDTIPKSTFIQRRTLTIHRVNNTFVANCLIWKQNSCLFVIRRSELANYCEYTIVNIYDCEYPIVPWICNIRLCAVLRMQITWFLQMHQLKFAGENMFGGGEKSWLVKIFFWGVKKVSWWIFLGGKWKKFVGENIFWGGKRQCGITMLCGSCVVIFGAKKCIGSATYAK